MDTTTMTAGHGGDGSLSSLAIAMAAATMAAATTTTTTATTTTATATAATTTTGSSDDNNNDMVVVIDETSFELYSDIALGIAFLITAFVAAKRMYINSRQLAMSTSLSSSSNAPPTNNNNNSAGNSNGGRLNHTTTTTTNNNNNTSSGSGGGGGGGAETTVVTAFYSLILATSVLRAIWFIVPVIAVLIVSSQQHYHLHDYYQYQYNKQQYSTQQQQEEEEAQLTSLSSNNEDDSTTNNSSVRSSVYQYTPVAVYAFDKDDTNYSWIWYAISEIIVTAGSLTLFSIFILILVYWADILKKYYNPGSRRSLPMATFLGLVATLIGFECVNVLLFLLNLYSTEGMILFNALLLASVSIVCVCEITIFSRKFQNVLRTLGAINQVSTDSQIRRIVWITVTGNLFFFSRALLETIFASMILIYYIQFGTIDRIFTHTWWDAYTLLKYWSEVTILALMLHILQSRFSSSGSARPTPTTATNNSTTAGYSKVPDASVNV